MKAEDTVMKEEQRRDAVLKYLRYPDREDKLCEAQAEISFKAGYKEAVLQNESLESDVLDAAEKAGIKEVVEWITAHPYYGKLFEGCSPFEWQAQLKDWGL